MFAPAPAGLLDKDFPSRRANSPNALRPPHLLPQAVNSKEGYNRLCGDQVKVYLKLE